MSSIEETIRENAGDAMNQNIQSPEGAKKLPAPDSNTSGVPDPGQGSQGGQGAQVGSVEQEQAALHQDAEKAKEAFADVAGGTAGAEFGRLEGSGEQGGEGKYGSAVDTEAPERARKQAEQADSEEAGSGEPSMGEMLAAELGSEPGMKWESKIVEKIAGKTGAMDSQDSTQS